MANKSNIPEVYVDAKHGFAGIKVEEPDVCLFCRRRTAVFRTFVVGIGDVRVIKRRGCTGADPELRMATVDMNQPVVKRMIEDPKAGIPCGMLEEIRVARWREGLE